MGPDLQPDRADRGIHRIGLPPNVFLVLVATAMILVGVWLPWMRNTGDKYILIDTESPGIQELDILIILLCASAVLAVIIGRLYLDWQPKLLLAVLSTPIWYSAGTRFEDFWRIDAYRVEPGIYLVLGGGLLITMIGLYNLCLGLQTDTKSSGRTGTKNT